MLRPVTLRPIHFVPFISSHAHFVPFTASPFILSQIHFVPQSICPIHFVPCLFVPNSFCPLTFGPKLILSHTLCFCTIYPYSFLHDRLTLTKDNRKKETFTLRSLLPRNSFCLCYLTKWCYSYDSMGDIEILKSKRGNPIV